MSNPYTSNPSWDQHHLYSQQNVRRDPDFVGEYEAKGLLQRKQPPQYQDSYRYPTQSSLQGALQTNQAHSRSSSHNSGLSMNPAAAGGYASPPVGQAPYRGNTFTFGTTNLPPLHGQSDASAGNGAYMTDSPLLQESFSPQEPQSRYYQPTPPQAGPTAKRARSDDVKGDESDSKADSSTDNKAKPARACARCKNLKVRCEAKTENEPCKRCLNGSHECFIPGRKIRRVPPKREHLINQIQSQAKEIERLMLLLGKAEGSEGDDLRDGTPFLSPSTTNSFLEPDSVTSAGPYSVPSRSGPATTKAIEDWIAKTRENMQELSYICVGGAGVPESYIVGEDLEDNNLSSDDEDEFVDVSENLFDDEPYRVAVQDPEGGLYPGDSHAIRHKLSASSMGTTKSAGTQKSAATSNATRKDKPANLPVEASPFGLFGNMSLKGRPRSRAPSEVDEEEGDKGSGIANENFFRPSESLVRQMQSIQHQAPAILTKGLITPAEAETLFQIYYAEMNLSVSLLDPVLYDAKRTFWRSPFLFTVICGVASRFYEERPELYLQAMHYAQLAGGTALISGTKNVEMCAAYILLSLYPIPAKKWEQQRNWLYLGLAIRTATDLNLHLPMTAKPKNENHARELLNRTRIWLNCFNLDRSTGSQYGKPPTISSFDYTANHSESWWNSSPQNLNHFDIHISAYNAELRLMSNFMAKIYSDPDHPTGLNKEVDFEALATQADDELQQLKEKWFSILDKTDMTDPENCFRTGLLRLAYSYSRLIALSYGFQHAFGKNDGQDENPFLLRCLSAATDVVNAVVKDIPRTMRHYFRHGPEAQSVFVTFASAFLVKLLQPKFASYLSQEQRVEIRNLVQQVIDLLAEVSLDDRHGPKLYSRFLKGLLAKPLAKLDPSAPDTLPTNPLPSRSRSRKPKGHANSASGSTNTSMDSNHPVMMMTDSAATNYPLASNNNHRTNSGNPNNNASNVRHHQQSYGFGYGQQNFGSGRVFGNQAPSPAASSPSPPPAESIASFDNFRPAGGIDPYAPDDVAAYVMHHPSNSSGGSGSAGVVNGAGTTGGVNGVGGGSMDMFMADYFQPELPFDEEIVRSIQDLSDPTGWQDISIPQGFNWMTQFQQNMGLDLRSASSAMGDLLHPSQGIAHSNSQHNNNNHHPANMIYDTDMNFLTGPPR